MIKVIKFDLADEDTRKQMITDKEIDFTGRGSQDLFTNMTNMLKTMENR